MEKTGPLNEYCSITDGKQSLAVDFLWSWVKKIPSTKFEKLCFEVRAARRLSCEINTSCFCMYSYLKRQWTNQPKWILFWLCLIKFFVPNTFKSGYINFLWEKSLWWLYPQDCKLCCGCKKTTDDLNALNITCIHPPKVF